MVVIITPSRRVYNNIMKAKQLDPADCIHLDISFGSAERVKGIRSIDLVYSVHYIPRDLKEYLMYRGADIIYL